MALVPSLNFSDRHNIGLLRFGGQPATNIIDSATFIPTVPVARYTVTRFWWLNQVDATFTGGGFSPLVIHGPPVTNANRIHALVTPFIGTQGTYDLLFSQDVGSFDFYSSGMLLARAGSSLLTTLLSITPDSTGSVLDVNPWSSPSTNLANYSSVFSTISKQNVLYWLRIVVNASLGFVTFLVSPTGFPSSWLSLTQQSIATLGSPNWVGFFVNPNDSVSAGLTATATLNDWGYSPSINIQAQASRSVWSANDVLTTSKTSVAVILPSPTDNKLVALRDFGTPYAYALANVYGDTLSPFMSSMPFFTDIQEGAGWNAQGITEGTIPVVSNVTSSWDVPVPYESLAYIPPNCIGDVKTPIMWSASQRRDANAPTTNKAAISEDAISGAGWSQALRSDINAPWSLLSSIRADWLSRLSQLSQVQRDVNVPGTWRYGITREDLIAPLAYQAGVRSDNVVRLSSKAAIREDVASPIYTSGASQAYTLNIPTARLHFAYRDGALPISTTAVSVKVDAVIPLLTGAGLRQDVNIPLTWKISVKVSWDQSVPLTWKVSVGRTDRQILFSMGAVISTELIVPSIWLRFDPPFDRTTYSLGPGGVYGDSPSRTIIARSDEPPYGGIIK